MNVIHACRHQDVIPAEAGRRGHAGLACAHNYSVAAAGSIGTPLQ
jgi:hypothetical protein